MDIGVLDSQLRNLRLALRSLKKSPGFSFTVVLTLALGIGANSAVFSAIDAILLRPLPLPEGDQLMELKQRNAKHPDTHVAPVRLEDWNRLNSTFQSITGYYTEDDSETTGILPERLTRAFVAPRFLAMWGASPELGRGFNTAEEHFGGPNAVLISDRYWRQRFGASADVLGKRLRLNNYSFEVIGVLPAAFALVQPGIDLWSPNWPDAPYAQSRDSTWLNVVGRLKQDVTLDQARANLAAVQARLGEQFPKTDAQLSVLIQPLQDSTVGASGRSLWLLFGSVSLLLLIACANIAALLLARSAHRRQEISVRYSLGATRISVAGQLLTEIFVLSVFGTLAGLAVAAPASRIFHQLAAALPRVDEIRLDWRVVLYSLLCTIVVTLVCGMLPAIRGSRRDVSDALMSGGRTQVSARHRLQWLLVGLQVALAVTLLSGAGLLMRSLQALGRVNPGFDAARVLTFRISGSWAETANMDALKQRIDRTLDYLRTMPGVEDVASAGNLPGIPFGFSMQYKPAEGGLDSEVTMLAEARDVSADYFATMRIPLLEGEFCAAAKEEAREVAVNRSFAETYYHGASPIGRSIVNPSPFGPRAHRITAIVENARETGLRQLPPPVVYGCYSAPTADPFYLVRAHGDPAQLAETIRRKIREIEPNRSVFQIIPLEERIDSAYSENRLRTILIGGFAVTALLLACLGLCGVLTYLLNLRRREVGLRLALGARRGRIVTDFLLQGLAVALVGCVAGIGLAIALRQLLAGMLYGVSPTDARTLSGVTVMMLAVAAGASLIPAIRAARVDPMQVLRDR